MPRPLSTPPTEVASRQPWAFVSNSGTPDGGVRGGSGRSRCEGVILHVTYTERGKLKWIISARRAERHEQDDYYRENAR